MFRVKGEKEAQNQGSCRALMTWGIRVMRTVADKVAVRTRQSGLPGVPPRGTRRTRTGWNVRYQ